MVENQLHQEKKQYERDLDKHNTAFNELKTELKRYQDTMQDVKQKSKEFKKEQRTRAKEIYKQNKQLINL